MTWSIGATSDIAGALSCCWQPCLTARSRVGVRSVSDKLRIAAALRLELRRLLLCSLAEVVAGRFWPAREHFGRRELHCAESSLVRPQAICSRLAPGASPAQLVAQSVLVAPPFRLVNSAKLAWRASQAQEAIFEKNFLEAVPRSWHPSGLGLCAYVFARAATR